MPGRNASVDGTGEAPTRAGDVWTQPPDRSTFYDDSLQSRARASGAVSSRIRADEEIPASGAAEGGKPGRLARRGSSGENSRGQVDGKARIGRGRGRSAGSGYRRSGGGDEAWGGAKTGGPRSDSPSGQLAARLRMSDATVARLGSTALWVLVILAAYGGVTAWLGAGGSSGDEVTVPGPGEVPDGRWAAAGFAERYVTAYLAAGADGSALSPFLGYAPELPPTADPATVTGPARAVDIQRADDRSDYWSVTVAVGNPASGLSEEGTDAEAGDAAESTSGAAGSNGGGRAADRETFWQAAIDTSGSQPVAVGLPAPVAGPPDPNRTPMATSLSQPPGGDPAVESVEGFLAAYLCGTPDLDRYLHPEAVLVAANPAICDSVDVVRWGAVKAAASDDTGSDERQTVVAEVELDSGNQARRATYGLTLAQRDGRWEIAGLLPAPPLKER